ncbi:NAD-dependent epimerase/dehydratase family protein [Anaeromicropila populeti]|uniref:Nucleoside-diphosphate-sugar epimerase n=1 Tax=Anaeromicropila populeti TaxID=37658 RepID=A0A1I6JN05_9FIRM|nr:NAD-dependent epimerase/dehydratase family protein [Anaeromicropila populeti]SFR80353.1 Nucleoside-diphosphate-sugar epimerase [Anaeromicropila populeti]
MKVLLIGGTGTISQAVTEQLLTQECELYLLNRGTRNHMLPFPVKEIIADINQEEALVSEKIENLSFDVVVNFIGYEKIQVERDYRLFHDKTKQYIYISSASVYQKPLLNYIVNEDTPLGNLYWEYARKKIVCEAYLMERFRKDGFPVTIIRPSHTYDERKLPVALHGRDGGWQTIKRMLDGKPVLVHGDGMSLWTVTHSKDLARGIIGLMGNSSAIGEAVQITSDECLTWNQIYAMIAKALKVPLQTIHIASQSLVQCSKFDFRGSLIGDKANSVVFDNRKLKRLVPGFKAEIPFEKGIRETVSYMLSHEECQTEDERFDKWCDRVILSLESALIMIEKKKINMKDL